jgi:hypothetical protein
MLQSKRLYSSIVNKAVTFKKIDHKCVVIGCYNVPENKVTSKIVSIKNGLERFAFIICSNDNLNITKNEYSDLDHSLRLKGWTDLPLNYLLSSLIRSKGLYRHVYTFNSNANIDLDVDPNYLKPLIWQDSMTLYGPNRGVIPGHYLHVYHTDNLVIYQDYPNGSIIKLSNRVDELFEE